MTEAAQATLAIEQPVATAAAVPAAAPAAEPAPTPIPAAAPAPEALPIGAPAEDAPAAVEEVKPDAAPEADKPADAPKPDEPAAEAEAKPEPTPEPVNYEFKYPDGFKADTEATTQATELFRELNVPPEQAQKLMDIATAAMKRQAEAQPEQWQKAFSDTKKTWLEEGMADPIIGGPAWKTSVQAANDVLANTALIPKSDRGAFNAMMRDTGTSHHPQMIRFLTRINSFMREPAAPPPATTPATGGNGAGSRKAAILTHSTSKPS